MRCLLVGGCIGGMFCLYFRVIGGGDEGIRGREGVLGKCANYDSE